MSADPEIDHEWTNEIVCPHCGTEDGDSWEHRDDEGVEYCPECGREFTWSRNISVTYSTAKLEKGGREG